MGTSHFKRAKNDAAAERAMIPKLPHQSQSTDRSLLLGCRARSNAAFVAIFSHNSAAKNAQKEAKGGKSAPLQSRSALQTTPTNEEILGWADWQSHWMPVQEVKVAKLPDQPLKNLYKSLFTVQGSAKRWALGCMNSPPWSEGARRRYSRNLGLTL